MAPVVAIIVNYFCNPDEKLCKNKLCKSIHGFMNNSFYDFFCLKNIFVSCQENYWDAHQIVLQCPNTEFWSFYEIF